MTDTARATGLSTLTTPGPATPAPFVRRAAADVRRLPDSISSSSQPVIGSRITVNGREFVVELDMAGIFLRQVRRSLRAGDGGLVLLRHVDGIEMIPITRRTPFEVTDIVCPEGVEPSAARVEAGLRAG
ncbi:hypothetical protein [Rathayibacter sp. SD072]|uniref:hypothetical protein n=1 Tax=Rathayibacter sp. SD072 TaxID=2781731 RepID=UPI001A979CC9|nr:hypothetical protein [Rathayibacter sp. SD072]MBO0984739.1 hypothetical protein [Rathayibacter sp. SD072]